MTITCYYITGCTTAKVFFFFFWGGGIFQGPHPPVWNPAQRSTIKGSIFTKHMKLGHSVYVYICTSIHVVVGLAQRPARKRLISTHHNDVDQSWNESHSLSSMFPVITISKLDIYNICQRRPLPIRRYRVANTSSSDGLWSTRTRSALADEQSQGGGTMDGTTNQSVSVW